MPPPSRSLKTDSPILIGVSSCLLGEKRRYDGKHKRSSTLVDSICSSLTCVSLCPEYAIGLGVPRDPIILTLDVDQQVHAIMQGNRDVTQRLQQYATDIKSQLDHLSGYVLKSKSPSCGVNSTSLHAEEHVNLSLTDGVFTAVLRDYYPDLPLCEETDLLTQDDIERFIVKVTCYYENKYL